jgi:hypothetical protein
MTTRSFSLVRVAASAAVLVIAGVLPAPAQTRDGLHVSLGAAAGVAAPFHGDFDFTATTWQADVRVDTTRHFGFDVFFEEWRHADERVQNDVTITGPTGLIGRVARLVARTEHTTRAVGWSLLGRGGVSRLTVTGGGGIGYLTYSRRSSQVLSGCEPLALCRDTSSAFDNGAFAAQLQGGADVAIVPHVAAMGQFRAVFPIEDPGAGHSTLMAGLRIGF